MRSRAFGLAALLLLFAGHLPAAAQDKTLTVFAAASLKNALDDVHAAYAMRTGGKIVASYAATPVLLKQIEEGAPADIFASADLENMDSGVQKKVIATQTRFNLLGNRLVLIAPRDSAFTEVGIRPGFDLAGIVGEGRIVTGDVRLVPIGKYAKAALEKLGAWTSIERKVTMVENARAALAIVARGEAMFGIVYEADANIEPNVKIVGRFPADSHPPVIFPVAATVHAQPDAKKYLDFLRIGTAQVIFQHYGFTYLVPAGP